MHWHAAYAHLVALGLYRDLLVTTMGTAVGVAGGWLAAWRPFKRHTANQAKIADLLDPGTPGGLGDLAAIIADALAEAIERAGDAGGGSSSHHPGTPHIPGGHHGAR